ncbi:hypothetical protein RUND412_007958 [Rhizina undulata]
MRKFDLGQFPSGEEIGSKGIDDAFQQKARGDAYKKGPLMMSKPEAPKAKIFRSNIIPIGRKEGEDDIFWDPPEARAFIRRDASERRKIVADAELQIQSEDEPILKSAGELADFKSLNEDYEKRIRAVLEKDHSTQILESSFTQLLLQARQDRREGRGMQKVLNTTVVSTNSVNMSMGPQMSSEVGKTDVDEHPRLMKRIDWSKKTPTIRRQGNDDVFWSPELESKPTMYRRASGDDREYNLFRSSLKTDNHFDGRLHESAEEFHRRIESEIEKQDREHKVPQGKQEPKLINGNSDVTFSSADVMNVDSPDTLNSQADSGSITITSGSLPACSSGASKCSEYHVPGRSQGE